MADPIGIQLPAFRTREDVLQMKPYLKGVVPNYETGFFEGTETDGRRVNAGRIDDTLPEDLEDRVPDAIIDEDGRVYEQPPQEESTFDFVTRNLMHGAKVTAGGVVDALQFPAFAIGEAADALGLPRGVNLLKQGVDANKDMIADIVGKKQEDYNLVENISHFGGGAAIPLPAKAGLSNVGNKVVDTLRRGIDAIIPGTAKGANAGTQLGLGTALPTAVVEGINSIKGAEAAEITPIQDTPAEESAPPVQEPEQGMFDKAVSWLHDNALYTAVGAGLVVGTKMLMRRSSVRENLGIIGKKEASAHTTGDVAKEQLVDRSVPLRNALDRLGTAEGDEAVTMIDSTATPGQLASRARSAMVTGELPNSTVRMQIRPATWIEAYSRLGLRDPAAQQLLSDALHAADDVDRRMNRLASKYPAGTTMADLQAKIVAARANPTLAKMMEAYQQVMRDLLAYYENAGLIDTAKRVQLAAAQPNYLPNVAASELKQGWGLLSSRLERAMADTDASGLTHLDTLMKRTGMLGVDEIVDPATGMEVAVSQAIRLAELNRVRVASTKALYATHGPDIIEPVRAGANDFNLTTFVHGQKMLWNVKDPVLLRGLEFNPVLVHGWFNKGSDWARRTGQNTTTGPVADMITLALTGVPVQSVASTMYEVAGALAMTPKGRSFNLLDAVVSVPHGLARAMYADAVRQGAQMFATSALSDGVLSRIVGPAAAKNIAESMFAHYGRSLLATYEKHGGGIGAFTEAPNYDQIYNILGRMAPQYHANQRGLPVAIDALHRGWQQFSWMHEAVQSSVRLHYAARNMSRGTPEEVIGEAAALTGNFFRRPADTRFSANVPYWNVTTQALAQLGKMAAENPKRVLGTITGLTGGGIGYMLWRSSADETYKHAIWNLMTPEQRMQGPVIDVNPENPMDYTQWVLPPEWRVLWAPTLEIMGSLSGMKTGEPVNEAITRAFDANLSQEEQAELQIALTQSLLGVYGKGGPVGMLTGAALSGLGYQFDMEKGITPRPRDKTTPGGTDVRENDVAPALGIELAQNILMLGGKIFVDAARGAYDTHRQEPGNMMGRIPDIAKGAYDAAAFAQQQRAARLTGMWDTTQRLMASNPEAKLVREKLEKVQELSSVLSIFRTGGEESALTGKQRVSVDLAAQERAQRLHPEGVQAAQYMRGRMKAVNLVKGEIDGLYKQLRDADASALEKHEKEGLKQQISAEIVDKQAQALQLLLQYEKELGTILGRQDFRFENLRLTR